MTLEARPAPPTSTRSAAPMPPAGPSRVSPLLEVATVIYRWSRVIAGFTAGVVLVTLLYTLLTPPSFKARATLLPQKEESAVSLAGLAGSLGSDLSHFVGGLGAAATPNDVLMTILESRKLRERIIERLKLDQALKIKAASPERLREQTLARLDRMVALGMTKRLALFVEVAAPSPELAATVANAFFSELDAMNQEFALESARRTRRFVEGRLKEAADSLGAAQLRLASFQSRHGMVAIDQQAKASVDVAARLQGELISLESQLEVLRKFSTGEFSRTRELTYRIEAIKNRINEVSGRRGAASDSSGFLIPFSRLPGLGTSLADLMMQVKTQEAVFALLTAQYQQSRIDEARDVPTIQPLDVARPPAYRFAPRRRQSLLMALLAGLGGGLLLAFAGDYLERTLAGAGSEPLRRVAGPAVARAEAWLRRLRLGG